MEKILGAILLWFFATICLAQNETTRSRKVNSRDLLKKLPKEITIPNGYTIFDVVDSVDLNLDNLKDIVVGWASLPLRNGDTTFYSIYTRNNEGKFLLRNTYGNLQSIYLTAETKGKNEFLDSLRKLYTGRTTVLFQNQEIIVKFPTSWDYFGKNYVFKYDLNEKTWILDIIQYWVGNIELGVIRKYNWSKEFHNENLLKEMKPESLIRLDELDLTKVMLIDGEEDWFYLEAEDKFDWFE